jgi:hypothetical protein
LPDVPPHVPVTAFIGMLQYADEELEAAVAAAGAGVVDVVLATVETLAGVEVVVVLAGDAAAVPEQDRAAPVQLPKAAE